jgi:CHAT domain-containing protein
MEQQLRPVTEVTTLCDGQADRQRVRQALTEHGWAHLACHAEHDLAQPDRSALLLADGPLALTQLTTRDGYHAEGAYLSACRTAFGAVDLTDEALHLAAALQYGGFRRVIGTLWPVRDAIAQSVARRVYSMLCDHVHFRPERSAHAVSDITRWLRDRYPDNPSVWASFVHNGP